MVNQQRAEEAKDQLRGQVEADPGSEFKLSVWLFGYKTKEETGEIKKLPSTSRNLLSLRCILKI